MSHKDHPDEAKRPAPTPVADRIRARIEAAGERFHANDNIARHIEHGELDALQAEVEARMAEVLRTLVIDVGPTPDEIVETIVAWLRKVPR